MASFPSIFSYEEVAASPLMPMFVSRLARQALARGYVSPGLFLAALPQEDLDEALAIGQRVREGADEGALASFTVFSVVMARAEGINVDAYSQEPTLEMLVNNANALLTFEQMSRQGRIVLLHDKVTLEGDPREMVQGR